MASGLTDRAKRRIAAQRLAAQSERESEFLGKNRMPQIDSRVDQQGSQPPYEQEPAPLSLPQPTVECGALPVLERPPPTEAAGRGSDPAGQGPLVVGLTVKAGA